jgi:CRISPR-associated protein Cas2
MPMTVMVTRNAPARYRGFLASCLLEVAPGVYTASRMSRAVRERVWNVCLEWSAALPPDGGVVMLWDAPSEPGGQNILVLGDPPKEIVEHEGNLLAKRPLLPHEATGGPDP